MTKVGLILRTSYFRIFEHILSPPPNLHTAPVFFPSAVSWGVKPKAGLFVKGNPGVAQWRF